MRGSLKITLKRLLIAIETLVMVVELGFTPVYGFTSISTRAMETGVAEELVQQEEPAQEENSSEAQTETQVEAQAETQTETQDETNNNIVTQAPEEGAGEAAEGTSAAASSDAGTSADTIAPEATGGEQQTENKDAAQPEQAKEAEGGSQSTPAEGEETKKDDASEGGQAQDKDAAGEDKDKATEDKDAAGKDDKGTTDKDAAGKEGEDKDKDGKDKSSTEKDKDGEDKDSVEKDAEGKDKEGKDIDGKEKVAEGLEGELEEELEEEPEEEEEPEYIEGELTTEEESLKISFDKDAEIPEGSEVVFGEVSSDDEEYENYINTALEKAELAFEEVAGLKVLDISIVCDDEEIEPQSGVYVEIAADAVFGDSALYADDEVRVIHIKGDDSEVLDAQVIGEDSDNPAVTSEAEAIGFSVNSFSAFVFMQLIDDKTLTVSDGRSYEITANFDNASGIPAGAKLIANEIQPDNEEINGYFEDNSELFDEEVKALESIRAFDICFIDAETGEEYQPSKGIQISIQLFDEDLDEMSNDLDVVHIHEENEQQPEIIESAVNDGAVEFEAESFSVFVVVRKVIEKTVTASDGGKYKITVNYDNNSGIPDAAQLSVSEILPEDDKYYEYVSASAEKLDFNVEKLVFARAFDISFINPETGEKYQPSKDVKVSIQLLNEVMSNDSEIGVVHFGNETEIMDVAVNEGAVEFETDGFSVYVVINHEGGIVNEARVEFHFIDRFTDAEYASGNIDITNAEAAPFNFVNIHNDYQTTQILKDGESLELINDPTNISVNNVDKFFYGWYVVTLREDGSYLNTNTGKYAGTIKFSWPANPDQVKLQQPVTLTKVDDNGDGKITVGDKLQWTIAGVGGEGVIDDNGSIHVYLAPLYEDFFFLNFHSSPRTAVTQISSLMTRKLVVFGSTDSSSVRIGNVICESPDPQHKFFSGWECDEDGDGNYDLYQTVTHTLDAEGNLDNLEVNSPGSTDGYYINVTKSGSAASYMDFYPVFDEARWLYFNRGVEGNNASYVGASYRLTNDNKTVDADYFYFDNDFFKGSSSTIRHISTRPGYDFGGWYLFANMNTTTGEITNLNSPEAVTVHYLDDDGDKQETTITTKAIKIVDGSGNIQTSVGKWYVDSNGVLTQTQSAGCREFFEVDSNGNLRFYRALNDMTLTAKWDEQQGTYRVIIWKQKVTDDKNATTAQKTYDYEIFYTSNPVNCGAAPNLEGPNFSGSYVDANGNTQNVNNMDLTARTYTGFHYARNDVASVGKPNPDGTTVYNVYYDRDLRAINFYYYVYNGTTTAPTGAADAYQYTVTTSNNGTQYGLAGDRYVQLTYSGGIWTGPEYGEVYTVDNTNGTYGTLDGVTYTLLEPVIQETPVYKLVNSNTLDTSKTHLIVQKNVAEDSYALGHNGTSIVRDSIKISAGSPVYIKASEVDATSIWTVSSGYKFKNGNYYLRRDGSDLEASTSDDTNSWTWNNNQLSMSTSGWISITYYLRYNNNAWSLRAYNSSNVYLYERGTIQEIVGYKLNGNDYTGNRYTKSYGPTGQTAEYTATRFTRSNISNSTRYKMITWTGLYGQSFAQNGYSWDDVSGYYWREGITEENGTGQTFLDSFIQETNPYNLVTRSTRGSFAIYHYRQQLNGKYTTSDREVAYLTLSQNTTFNFTDKFDGFTVASFNKGNNGFDEDGGSPAGASTTISNSDGSLHVYHTRNKYDFTFDVNYPIDGNLDYSGGTSENLTVPGGIYYEAPLTPYGSSTSEGITHWYYGVVNSTNTADHQLKGPAHYVFGGWYEDKSCTKAFDFSSTMPAANKIVYAKWTPERFIIEVDPNGGELDHVNHDNYSSFGSGDVTIDGQPAHYDFTTINSHYTNYPLPGAGDYNSNALQTYIRSSYGNQLVLYDPARRFVAMSDSVAAQYSGTVFYYVNYQWAETDGASGIHNDVRSALYLTESELQDFYNLYYNVTTLSLGRYASSNQGMTRLSYDIWKQIYVAHDDNNKLIKYRPLNTNESWIFLGWYKTPINEDGTYGTEDNMPYNPNDPVTGRFKLTAHWRLDGGYSIHYVPNYTMEDGDVINGDMIAWRDPVDTNLTYADGAKTEIYKAPTGLKRNGVAVTDDEVIFRGWALVSKRDTASGPVYTPLEKDTDGNITTFYFPSDDYTVNAANADLVNDIYFQAIYQYKENSDRRPKVTNLTLDANTGYIYVTDGTILPQLKYPGVHAINTLDHLDIENRPTQILFGDFQTSAAIHLYQYATELTQAADNTPLSDAHQFFKHPNGYFLLGFDNNATEGDYVADYPADSVIAVTRNDNRTIYAVWEPMVYVTFVNNTNVPNKNVSFGLQSTTNEALEVINVIDGMYERRPVSDYSNITLGNGESITLAFPKGAEKSITISGTNTLGVGKKLLWNTSLQLEGSSETLDTTGKPTKTVTYEHTYEGNTHSHTLVGGEVNNTRNFSFEETLIVNKNALTVTFTSTNYDYALLLDDNYGGGGVQEFDYALADIQPANGVPKTQRLPITSTRIGYSFIGWAEDPNATVAEYSATDPAANPWTILDLNKDNGFFADAVEVDDVMVKTLYAVWVTRTDAIYIYKNVPEPGNTKQPFTFTVRLQGDYVYQGTYYNFDVSDTVKIIHGEYIKINYENNNPTEANVSGTALMKATVRVYSPKSNPDGTTSYEEDTGRIKYVTWTKTSVIGSKNNHFANLNLSVTETPETHYDTTVTLSAENDDQTLAVGGHTYNMTELPKTHATNTVSWDSPFVGGTFVFTNQRHTYNVKVSKTLESNTSAQAIFGYDVSYTETYENLEETTVTTSKTLNSFNVTSGNFYTLEDIPAGVDLTITEKTDSNNNYKIYSSVDGAAETESASCSTFRVGVNPSDVPGKTHTVAFRNVLKSYPVTFKLVDQDGHTTIDGMFALSSAIGSLGNSLPASKNSVNPPPGVFYTSSKFWVGSYTLVQRVVESKYIGLSGGVTLTVTGNGITSNDENVIISGNATAGYLIEVRNWKTVDITLEAGLLDPMVIQRSFEFYGTYKLNDKTYDLNRNLISDVSEATRYNLIAYSTSDGSVSSAHVPRTFAIPVGATDLTFWENRAKETVAPDTIATTYDTYVQYKGGERTLADVYTYSVAVSDSHEGDHVSFINVKKTVKITVVKVMTTEDISGNLTFEAKISNGVGAAPVKSYPIYDKFNTPANPADDEITDPTTGIYQFSLCPEFYLNTIVLTVPIGATLTIQETAISGHTSGNDLELFAVSADTKLTVGGTTFTGDTRWDEATRVYNLVKAPSTALTVTFTNAEGGKEVYFKKVDGFNVPLGGAEFSLYDTLAHAQDHTAAGLVDIIVNSAKVKKVTSENSFDTTTHAGEAFNVSFKVKMGVYYMIETNRVDGYQKNENIYRVAVGKKGESIETIQLPNDRDFLINLYEGGEALEIPNIQKYGILNIKKDGQKVILRKVENDYDAVPNATFEVLRFDRSPVKSTDINGQEVYRTGDVMGTYVSGASGAYFVDNLPIGEYYIHETNDGSGSCDYWFTLTVNDDEHGGAVMGDRQTTAPVDPTP